MSFRNAKSVSAGRQTFRQKAGYIKRNWQLYVIF